MTQTIDTRNDAPRRKSAADEQLVQLNGLRAVAVLGVIVQHYLGRFGNAHIPLGSIGVRVFFVLSGFLITGILLRERQSCDHGLGTPLQAVNRFYARRFLRIFPLYYFVLAVAIAVNVSDIRNRWGWQVAYLSNVFYAMHPDQVGREAHFWSLSVEEQFYLFWPLVLLLMPRRQLSLFLIFTVCSGPLFRLGMMLCGAGTAAATLLTPACADSLAIGAILALLSDPRWGNAARREWLIRWGGRTATLLMPISLLFSNWHPLYATEVMEAVLFSFASAALGVWLVGRGADGFGGAWGRVLEHPAMSWIGARSYGVYVYHFFMPAVVLWLLQYAHLSSNHGLANLIAAPLTFAVAAASWATFERPLNDLKRLFPYPSKAKSAERRPVVVSQALVLQGQLTDAAP